MVLFFTLTAEELASEVARELDAVAEQLEYTVRKIRNSSTGKQSITAGSPRLPIPELNQTIPGRSRDVSPKSFSEAELTPRNDKYELQYPEARDESLAAPSAGLGHDLRRRMQAVSDAAPAMVGRQPRLSAPAADLPEIGNQQQLARRTPGAEPSAPTLNR